MDKRRMAWMVFLAGGAGLLLALYFQYGQGDDPPVVQTPVTQPADQAQATSEFYDQLTENGAKGWYVTDVPPRQFAYDVGSLDKAHGYPLRLQVLNTGAAVYTAKLTHHFATYDDKVLYKELEGDESAYQAKVAENPDDLGGHYSLINPVTAEGTALSPTELQAAAGKVSLAMSTGWLRVRLGKEEAGVWGPVLRWNLGTRGWKLMEDQTVRDEAGTVTSVKFKIDIALATSAEAAESEENILLRVVKTYTVRKEDYTVGMSLSFQNLSGYDMEVAIEQAGPTGLPREDPRNDGRMGAFARQENEEDDVEVLFRDAGRLEGQSADYVDVVGSTAPADWDKGRNVLWVGTANKFFAGIMYLKPAQENRRSASMYNANYFLQARPESPTSKTFVTGILVGQEVGAAKLHEPLTIKSGDPARQMDFDVYLGPKDRHIFTDEENPYYRPLYTQLNFIDTIRFSSCFCAFSPLAIFMMATLETFSEYLFFGNFGLAIMLLVVLVRLVLHPLTKKGQVSMMRMQKLTPKIAKIKEKYADDKDTQQKEIMQLYKQAGATPILGCLPMFLQMPIWIALWSSLNAAIALRHENFLPVWLTDLASPDALVSWSTPIYIPLISNLAGPITSFNLLPILLCIAMYLQTKINPSMAAAAGGGGASSDQAKQQAKMMKYFMPAFLLLIFYNAPSGLTLYIMTSTFAGVAEQQIIRRHIAKREEAEEQAETKVVAPGKRSRNSRPKKPKGPFFVKRG